VCADTDQGGAEQDSGYSRLKETVHDVTQ